MADPYISEVKYLGAGSLDFIEVAVDAGMDVSGLTVTVYNPSGTVRSVNALGTLVNTVSGKDIYVIDVATSATFNGLHKNGAVALDDGTQVFEFYNFDGNPPLTAIGGAADGMASTGIGTAGAGSSLEAQHGGGGFTTQTSPTSGTIPCFTAGTLIATPSGETPVEALKPGDEVLRADGTTTRLTLALSRRITAKDMEANFRLRPVLIRAGSLGGGLPRRDLLISRQHRMQVSSRIAARMFGETEVLVAAIRLTKLPGIRIAKTVETVTYVHLLFDTHEVILAEGAPSESLFVGQGTLRALPPEIVEEITTLFPDVDRPNHANWLYAWVFLPSMGRKRSGGQTGTPAGSRRRWQLGIRHPSVFRLIRRSPESRILAPRRSGPVPTRDCPDFRRFRG